MVARFETSRMDYITLNLLFKSLHGVRDLLFD